MKKPKIRFKGYQEDWEQRKLDDVLERRIEQRQQSEEYPRLAFASGQGVIPLSERKTNNREQLTKDEFTKKYLVTELDDIVYNPANVKYGAIDRNKCGRGLISPIYVTFTTSEISGFIERIVTSHDFQQKALKFEEGTVTKRQSVNPEDFLTIDIWVARQREEQRKISKYFDNLDHLITLHHRKYMKYADLSVFDWEQRKLGELGSLKNGMNFSKEAMGIGFPFVNLQNIFGNNVIDVTNLGKAMASDSQLKDYNLLNGDVLFVRSSVKLEGVGEAALVPQNLENTTYSGFIIRFRDEYGLDNNFKRFLFGIESVRNQIMAQATNSANKNISQTVLENLCLKIPNKSEQEKIGLYFSNLDHLITLHQRKCEETKTLKKYMLQKMFPQNGHSVPEIRFSGFTEDWEQRKFADFTWDAGKRNKEDLDLEPYAITNEHGFIRQRDAHDDFGYMKDTDRKAYNIVQPNSFAYNPARINVGSIGYYKGVENVIVSSLYEVFQTDNYVNDRFLWHWLKSDEFPRWIEKLQEGSVRLYFYYDKLCECQLYMPSLEEQEKIATFLDDLDHLITLHQHKCEELQNIKKFMLKNMFI